MVKAKAGKRAVVKAAAGATDVAGNGQEKSKGYKGFIRSLWKQRKLLAAGLLKRMRKAAKSSVRVVQSDKPKPRQRGKAGKRRVRAAAR